MQVLEQDGDKYYEMRLAVGLLLLVVVIVLYHCAIAMLQRQRM